MSLRRKSQIIRKRKQDSDRSFVIDFRKRGKDKRTFEALEQCMHFDIAASLVVRCCFHFSVVLSGLFGIS